MTNRQGRRRRHKQHKARAKHHPNRTWHIYMLGWEFEDMRDFMAGSCPRGAYRDLEGNFCMARPGQDYVDVAHPPQHSYLLIPPNELPIPCVVRVMQYRLVRQRQSMLFYEGRNRRTREIPAKMERVL